MPATQALTLIGLSYVVNTGKDLVTHEEKHILKKQREAFTELSSVNS